KPVPPLLIELANKHRLVVTVEDNGRVGGFGATLTLALSDAGSTVPVRVLGLPQEFLQHGSRAQILADAGLGTQDVARAIVEAASRLAPRASEVVDYS
ncbi:MAG: dxs, partial [Frankiales bacterium]|nr:dxs [Frankiales bacterium]